MKIKVMDFLKNYKEMTPEEQVAWLTDFSTFTKSKMPILLELGEVWSTAHRASFEGGLHLLSAFPYCRDFVKNALMWQDYPRRIRRMAELVGKVTKEISRGFVLKGIDGEQVVYVPTANVSKRRGRPTKEEAAAAAAAEAENKIEETRAMAIAELNGATPMERTPEREKNNEELLEEKRKEESQTPNLFGDFEKAESRTSAVDMQLTDNRLHLHQIAFLLAPATAADVARVREIRVELGSSAERAKLLAEQKAAPEAIAPYAKKAAELTKEVEDIYLRVDRELARLYVLMPMDHDLDGHREAVEQRKLSDADLLAILKPYYDKTKREDHEFEKNVIAEFEASRPEVIAAKKAEEERREEISALRKYIMRTDKKPSQKRIEGIRERIERLKELGEDVSGMVVILEKTIEDNGQEGL